MDDADRALTGDKSNGSTVGALHRYDLSRHIGEYTVCRRRHRWIGPNDPISVHLTNDRPRALENTFPIPLQVLWCRVYVKVTVCSLRERDLDGRAVEALPLVAQRHEISAQERWDVELVVIVAAIAITIAIALFGSDIGKDVGDLELFLI